MCVLQDRRSDLVGGHGGFGHLVTSNASSFSAAPRLCHTPGGPNDQPPPFYPPPHPGSFNYQQMDFHSAVNADAYSQVNPFSQQNHHYNQLSDRGNILRHRDDALAMTHPGLSGSYADARRTSEYMNAVRRPDAVLHGHPGSHVPGLQMGQDPGLLGLHHVTNGPPALPGLGDASQVSGANISSCSVLFPYRIASSRLDPSRPVPPHLVSSRQLSRLVLYCLVPYCPLPFRVVSSHFVLRMRR